MTTQERWVYAVAAAVCVLIVLLVASFPLEQDDGPPPLAPRPVSHLPKPVAASVRASLPTPEGVERPEIPRERPEPAALTGEDRRLMNVAVDNVLRAARDECLGPWLGREGDGDSAEFVFDAVLHDGRLVDVGFRSMRLDVPSDVVQCVADRAWYAEWPEWDIPGELRLQRSIDVLPVEAP